MVKALLIADTHNDLPRLEDALNSDVDVVIHAGDFTDMDLRKQKGTSDHASQFAGFFSKALGKKNLPVEEKDLFMRALQIMPALQTQNLEALREMLQYWKIPQQEAEGYVKKLAAYYQEHLPMVQELQQEALSQLEKYVLDEENALANVLKGKNILGVAGNHDRKSLYTNLGSVVHFLDTKGPQNFEGFVIGGVDKSCYELLGLDAESFPHVFQGDPAAIKKIFGREGDEGDVSVDAAYQRIMQEKPDLLVVHKGIGNHAIVRNDAIGYHKGVEKAVQESGVRAVFSGHSHQAVVKRVMGRLDIVAGPDVWYEVEIDPATKEIGYIDVFKYLRAEQPTAESQQAQQEMAQAA